MFWNYKFLRSLVVIMVMIPVGFLVFLVFQSQKYDSSLVNASDKYPSSQNLKNWTNVILNNQSTIKPKVVEKKIKLPILMYHHIDTAEKIPKTDKVGIGLRVSPEIFEKQLQYLVSKKYKTV